jgi:hypothetical protein
MYCKSHKPVVERLRKCVFPRTGPAHSQLIQSFQSAMRWGRVGGKTSYNGVEPGFAMAMGCEKEM